MRSFLDFVKNDWWIAIPMFLMSFTGVTLVIWRILLNVNGKTKTNEFLPLFQQKLDKEGVDSAINLCRKRTDIIPRRLMLPALEVFKQGQGLAAVRRTMANAIELEIIPDLNFLLSPILAIAKIATMVGLFGTVISMTKTFAEMNDAASGGVQAQTRNIGLALYATALGLITAIPLVFTHVLFKSWVHNFEVEMKKAALKLVVLLQAYKPGGGAKKDATLSAAEAVQSKIADAAAVRR